VGDSAGIAESRTSCKAPRELSLEERGSELVGIGNVAGSLDLRSTWSVPGVSLGVKRAEIRRELKMVLLRCNMSKGEGRTVQS
jgi:hypothetical protein